MSPTMCSPVKSHLPVSEGSNGEGVGSVQGHPAPVVPVSVKKKVLLGEPLPCNPSAETAIQPLIWSSESLSS